MRNYFEYYEGISMNKLFTKSALYAVINPINSLDEEDYDYSKFYTDFFSNMVTNCANYTSPHFLEQAIDEQANAFIDDFKTAFGNNKDIIKQTLYKTKFLTSYDYFIALRMKFAVNLLEAIAEAFFKFSNTFAPRLQPFRKYEAVNNSEDDFNGADGWLISPEGIKIAVNAKHAVNDAVIKDIQSHKLQSATLMEWRKLSPDLYAKTQTIPSGVIFTDSCVGRPEDERKFKHEEFPGIIVIDETTLFKTIGTVSGGIPNTAFWTSAKSYFF